MSVAEAAQVLGISTSTAYRLTKSGLIRTVDVGPRKRVPVEELARLLSEGTGTDQATSTNDS